jgi:hypothetical protein
VPFTHVNTHPRSIIQQQLVEFHPLDLIGVGVGDERLGHQLPKNDVYQIPPRAPVPHPSKFLRETGLRKLITYPKNLADPESVRKSEFSDLIPRKFFALEQKDSVASLRHQSSDRRSTRTTTHHNQVKLLVSHPGHPDLCLFPGT